jgi:hypothetical protein
MWAGSGPTLDWFKGGAIRAQIATQTRECTVQPGCRNLPSLPW